MKFVSTRSRHASQADKLLLGLLIAVATCVVGCSRDTSSVDADRPIKLALNWFPDAQHAGFYAAESFGLFGQHQPHIRIIPGGPGAPVVQNLAMKQVDFAVGNADQILMARAKGAPVVAILASMQTSPRCIMVHRETGIHSLRELSNVTLALGAGKAFAQFLQQQVPLKNVKVVPYTGSIALFMESPRFAQQAYIFSEPYVVQQKGADVTTLLVSELGFDPYTSCLMTHEETIRSNPDLVRRVVRGVRLGWRAYFNDPQPVHELILRENPQMDRASLEYGMQALRPLCLPPGGDESHIGVMEPKRWQELRDQLIALELLPAETNSSDAFTNEFIEPLGNNEPMERSDGKVDRHE